MTERELRRLVDWIERTRDLPTSSDLLLPGTTTGRVAHAPNIPALGVLEMEQTPSGLLIPTGGGDSFMQLVASFATASDAVGRKYSYEEIQEVLERVPLRPFITILARLVSYLEIRSSPSPQQNRELLSAFLPPEWAQRIAGMVATGERVPFAPQVLLVLTKLALLYCPEGDGEVPLQLVGILALAVADYVLSGSGPGTDSLALEVARNVMFYSRGDPRPLWGRYQRIWLEIAPSLKDHPDFVDVARVIRAATGVPFKQYLALGVALYLSHVGKAYDPSQPLWTPLDMGDFSVTPDRVRNFVLSWSGERDWFRDQIGGEAFLWDFTALRRRPLLRHGADFTALSSKFIVEKGTEGIYYTVLDYLREKRGLSESHKFSAFFGAIWEKYVSRLIDEGIGDPGRVITEEQLKGRQSRKKVCDRAIVYSNQVVLVEAVAHRLRVESMATGEWEALQDDLATSVTVKARQLAATVERLLDHPELVGLSGTMAMRFTPLVALPGPFPNVPPVRRRILDAVASDDQCKALASQAVDPLVVLSADDLEILLGTARASGLTAVSLLEEWQSSGLSDASFWNWVTTARSGQASLPDWIIRAKDALLDQAEGLFRPGFFSPGREWRIVENRRERVQELRARGIEPYALRFDRDCTAGELVERWSSLEPGQETDVICRVAGRLVLKRDHGRLLFLTIRDRTGDLQLLCQRMRMEQPSSDVVDEIERGDIVGAVGRVIKTRKGEVSVEIQELMMLSKALRPLPEKWRGLRDPDLRQRQRYLELATNLESRRILVDARAKTLGAIRTYLDQRDFVEVETPVLQPVAGGALARPFTTFHKTLGLELKLRISLELYLKRLLVGGLERVYEIGRNFRNEGIGPKYNPEFTMLEAYEAYGDYHSMMSLAEELVTSCAQAVQGSLQFRFRGRDLDLKPPWRRITVLGSVSEAVGQEVTLERTDLADLAERHGVGVDPKWGPGKIVQEMFEKLVEETLFEPTFVCDFPREVSPLARRHRENPELTEHFDLVIGGIELATAFSELIDPIEQRARFEAQGKAAGEDEAHPLDEDFLRALEYGMPPAGGIGVGVDRLLMVLTDTHSIRDIILFPLMRPQDGRPTEA